MLRFKLAILNIRRTIISDRGIDLTIVLATLNQIDSLPELIGHIASILNKKQIKYQSLFF